MGIRAYLRTVVVLLALAAPAGASAATRYADPSGSGTTCTQAAPCDIVTAVNSAASGDTVIVGAGTYGSGSPVSTALNPSGTTLTIEGAMTGAGRPQIISSATPALTVAGSASDLAVESTANGGNAVWLGAGATATRLSAVTGASGGDSCVLVGAGITLTDSVCFAQNSSNRAGLSLQTPNGTSATLRNDTLVGHYGLYNNGQTVTAVDSIISGSYADVGNDGTATLNYDEYSSVKFTPVTSTGQVSAAPEFVDAANGDFHEASGAPSIDAGTINGEGAPYDLDGNLRDLNSTPDIGAYESPRTTAPGVRADPATAVGPTSATLNGTVYNVGDGTSYHFIYGLSSSQLSSSTPTQTTFGAPSDVALSAQISGLTPGDTYYYELVVTTTGGGTSTSNYQSFVARAPETRYADPHGTASTDCVQATPCDIATAMNRAQDGDTVVVNSGTYFSAGAPLGQTLNLSRQSLTVEGAGSGSQRPVIYSQAPLGLYVNGSASDLDIRVANGIALWFEPNASGARLAASASDQDACVVAGTGVTLIDSLCENTSGGNSGLSAGSETSVELRNDTVIGSYGLYLGGGSAVAVNSIFSGGNNDIENSAGSVTLTNCEYQTTSGTISSSTGRVSAAPQFVNAAAGDFHEAAGAPSIDVGVDDPANGTTDLDGEPRHLASHTDIGAYEYLPAPVPVATAATGVKHTTLTANGTLDTGGLPASYHFAYGTSAGSLTSATPTQTLAAGSGPRAVSADLSGLSAAQTYYYALVVTTDGGGATSSPPVSVNTTPVATRYADPAGRSTNPCTQAAPCDIVTAINDADVGDTVIVNPGTYGSSGSQLTSSLNPNGTSLTIRGAGAGANRPVIYDSGFPALTVAGSASDLTLRSDGLALIFNAGATGTRLVAETEVSGEDGCQVAGSGVVLTDSVCWEQVAGGGSGLTAYAGVTLRNDTLIGATGLFSESSVTAINCILAGSAPDSDPYHVDYYSNLGSGHFQNVEYVTAGGVPLTSDTGRVNAAPQFVGAPSGDFHEAARAPSIDAGLDDPANGSTDPDGEPRQLGAHTDIGAYEFVPPPTATVSAATDLSTAGATLNGSAGDQGVPGSYHFVYSTSAGSLSSSTATQSLSASAAGQSVSAPLTGLQPGTTYTFELVITTDGGTVSSAPLTFTTTAVVIPPPPPPPAAAPPSVSLTSPRSGGRYVRYSKVAARYSCAEGARGPGLSSCTGTVASGHDIDTSRLGRRSFAVTAVSRDGQRTVRTVTYTVTAPDNRFTVSRIATHGNGTVTFSVKVPGAGLLEALASEWNDNFASTASVSPAPNRSAYGSVTSRLKRGGTYRFTLRPNAKGRKLIASHRYWVILRLVVQFTPTGGYARREGFFHIHPLPRPR